MLNTLPIVGIACDVISNGPHQFHGAGEKYINALAHGAGVMPMLLPAFGDGKDIRDLNKIYSVQNIVSSLSGLFLTGSPSNIQPHHFDGPAHEAGTLEDPQRDSLTLQLIKECVAQSVPVLAVCRGFQELNVALGGTLHAKVHEIEGYIDHREDKAVARDDQYATAHLVNFVSGGLLHELTGQVSCSVNSLHSQGIDVLSEQLCIEAIAEDGLIEAVSWKSDTQASLWMLGLQWHPEWLFESNSVSKAIFTEFGNQVQYCHQQKS
ncbi:MAG: gamma-glutamyl-gamma-aminobutyrate hydrolase family protein [Porticoccaceae bacterium]|nr:gamma-glutamyl-gamma-aminobutyrate hydrolase family protein [Porticoccaceae bacterium]MDG1473379.1 gamma-glutamyl-gamma-aminobutyrate hydrolase family protein [Porticoccaceae bacterium]